MERYNQKLLNKIFSICERNSAASNVGPKHYKEFLELSDKQMEFLIGHIIAKNYKYINRKILNDEWKTDEEMYNYIKSFLEKMALGIVGIRMEDGKLCFYKPVGDPPDKHTEKELDMKIQNSTPIIDKVLLKSL